MDMLVPYTPVAELSEDQKKRLKTIATKLQNGFTIIDGKVISANEAKGLAPQAVMTQRQNLFE